jgi:hypothetical protein
MTQGITGMGSGMSGQYDTKHDGKAARRARPTIWKCSGDERQVDGRI